MLLDNVDSGARFVWGVNSILVREKRIPEKHLSHNQDHGEYSELLA